CPGPHPAVDFRLLCPRPQCLPVNTQLTCDPGQFAVPLTLPLPDLEQHLHRAFAQLIRVLLLCRHDRASSQVSWPPRFPGWPTSLSDLLNPKFKNAIALNGDPTSANAALNGVMMASLAEGGNPDSIAQGVDFFKNLK